MLWHCMLEHVDFGFLCKFVLKLTQNSLQVLLICDWFYFWGWAGSFDLRFVHKAWGVFAQLSPSEIGMLIGTLRALFRLVSVHHHLRSCPFNKELLILLCPTIHQNLRFLHLCEKVVLGWRPSSTLIVLTDHAPEVLVLLRWARGSNISAEVNASCAQCGALIVLVDVLRGLLSWG